MSKLIIEIDLNNDAFQGVFGGEAEVARILTKYAANAAEWGVGSRALLDVNGNTVGKAAVTQ
jgi:hypothetical protein